MNIFKLGKKPPKIDYRTLQMSRYRMTAPIPVPTTINWAEKVPSWPMFLNDTIGDCTCAAAGHMLESWTAYAESEFVATNGEILSVYEAVGDYNPNDPSTDNGATLIDVLNYWRQNGIAGHKIAAYVQVNLRDLQEVREALYLFGNVYCGVALPISAQGQDAWTVPQIGFKGDGAPGSWGGHCVPIVKSTQDTQHQFTCVTWGSLLDISKNFFLGYFDEAYAVLSLDWIEKNGRAPSQFNLDQLQKDLEIVTA